MIYYGERHETIDRNHEGCLSLGCAGKFIAFIELLFYAFIFFTVKSYLSSKWKKFFDKKIAAAQINRNFFFFSRTIADINGCDDSLINSIIVPLHWCLLVQSRLYYALDMDKILYSLHTNHAVHYDHHPVINKCQ